jgi:cytochrome c553
MAKGTELFNASVGKLLADHCVKCHGGEKGVKGGLDLTTRELLMKGGEDGAAIVPGKSTESLLVKSIRHEDPDLKMPKKADKLPDDAIVKIAAWIDLGAPYAKPLIDGKAKKDRSVVTDEDRKWWAFQPLATPAPPEIRNQKSEPSGARQTAAGSPQGEAGGPNQIRNPIDAFLIAAQQAKGVAMNPPASRRVLIRRAYLDVIGLPPTPEQVEAFVNDKSPDAWTKVVDALLASPHYGERWGRHWLDLVRYAESHGYEQDYDRPNAWHYRDFVIRAFNADQPFDEFVRWQIAGDELAPENPEAWKATGFLAAGTHATQITANQAEKERYDELDDLAQTIGTSMLGLTIGCARCHDHKYDPIPTTDYYRLISTFTTTVRSDYDIDVDPAKYKAAKVAWDTAHAPLVAARDRFEKEQLPARLAVVGAKRCASAAAKVARARQRDGEVRGRATFTKQPDGSFLASGTSVEHDTYTFTVPAPIAGITAVKLDALADKSFVKSGPGRADNGNFALSNFELSVGGQPAKFVRALADFEQNGLPVAAAIDADPVSSWAVDPQFGKDHSAVFVLDHPLAAPAGTALTFTLKFNNNTEHSIGRPRLAVTADANPSLEGASSGSLIAEAIRVLEKPAAQRTSDDTAKLLAWYRTEDAEWKKLDAAVAEHARDEPKPEKVKALICSEGVPAVRLHTMGPDFYEKTFLLQRGDLNPKAQRGAAGFPHGRLACAGKRWIAPPPAGSRTPMRRTALGEVDHRCGRRRGRTARARGGEPIVAAPFRARHRRDAERFRRAGRQACASRVARFSRRRVGPCGAGA